MAHMAAVVNRRAFLSKVTVFSSPSTYSYFRSTALRPTVPIHSHLSRSYSRHTKTQVQVKTSELEQEIKQLERAIAEQERKLAAKKAYDDMIRERKQRSETARSVYQTLTSPMATGSTSGTVESGNIARQIAGGSHSTSQSNLPETFLQDLRLTFLDARTDKAEKLKQLQDGLPSSDDLTSAAAAMHLDSSPEQGATDESGRTETSTVVGATSKDGVAELAQKDPNQLAFERLQNVGINEWNKLIYFNALQGDADKAEQVMKMMEEIGVQPDMDSFTNLMEAYSRSDNLEKAQGTIELMLSNGIVPAMAAYNSLMTIHVQRRDIKGAFQVFEALKTHHLPDATIFTNMIRGCLRVNEYDLGWKVFDQMQYSSAAPLESTYSLMIHACAKTDQVERALDIFRTYPNRKLQPTSDTFNSLIHACAMRPEYFTTAFALLNEMQSEYGFQPNIWTYNTLLFACSKRRDLLTARRIFQKVVQLDSEGELRLDGITMTNFLWCVTEWKDPEVHQKKYKQLLRNSSNADNQAENTTPASIPPTTENTTTDIATRPSYFLLSDKPPTNEEEALQEGEAVFSWYMSRPSNETENSSEMKSDELDQKDSESLEKAHSTPLHVKTRLMNAYLAMYVRHNSIEKSIDIYRKVFDQYGLTRDSWTYSTMLEGCYNWKDVDLGAQVFRDWRDWRKSTGLLTEKRTRQSDYNCYRRMINLLARTNHLDESIALLEELSIAATPRNTRLLSELASASESDSFASSTAPSSYTQAAASSTSESSLTHSRSSVIDKIIPDKPILPIYPRLKDFPLVYTKTWELEDESARRVLLRICNNPNSVNRDAKDNSDEDQDDKPSIVPMIDKRKQRYQKSLRNTAIKWKGEHGHGQGPSEKGFIMSHRRLKELDQDMSRRGQDQRRSFKGPKY
ncbi:hypothetical protein FBU30_006858 [Linnemannia zychae]|nr:hypothetical protein FBU30_006858 [Linnemannia zychae]